MLGIQKQETTIDNNSGKILDENKKLMLTGILCARNYIAFAFWYPQYFITDTLSSLMDYVSQV